MRNCWRWGCAIAVVALLAAASGMSSNAEMNQKTGAPPAAQSGEPSPAPPSPPNEAANVRAFDGVWSVVIYTTRGDCEQALRYSLRIVEGRVVSMDQAYRAFGKVEADGAIRVRVSERGRSASGVGHLAGNAGRGEWRTSNGQCRGQWRAVRHGRID